MKREAGEIILLPSLARTEAELASFCLESRRAFGRPCHSRPAACLLQGRRSGDNTRDPDRHCARAHGPDYSHPRRPTALLDRRPQEREIERLVPPFVPLPEPFGERVPAGREPVVEGRELDERVHERPAGDPGDVRGALPPVP